MADATQRKRFNRKVSRRVEKGFISEREAQWHFVRGNSSSWVPLQRLRFDVQQQTSDPVETQPWQYKGEGKGGSLGVSVGSSRIVAADAGNAHCQALEKVIPDAPNAYTKKDVQLMFDNGYFRYPETPFWNGKDIWQVKRGTHCLWKNVPVGKRGGQSTKVEFFHGEVQGWDGDEAIVS